MDTALEGDSGLVDVLQRIEVLQDSLIAIQKQEEQRYRDKRDRVASFHFWISVTIPAVVAILSALISAYVTVVYRR